MATYDSTGLSCATFTYTAQGTVEMILNHTIQWSLGAGTGLLWWKALIGLLQNEVLFLFNFYFSIFTWKYSSKFYGQLSK